MLSGGGVFGGQLVKYRLVEVLVRVPAVDRVGVGNHRGEKKHLRLRALAVDQVRKLLDETLFGGGVVAAVVHAVAQQEEVAAVLPDERADVFVVAFDAVDCAPASHRGIDVGDRSSGAEDRGLSGNSAGGRKAGSYEADRVFVHFRQLEREHQRPDRGVGVEAQHIRCRRAEGDAVAVEDQRGALAFFQFPEKAREGCALIRRRENVLRGLVGVRHEHLVEADVLAETRFGWHAVPQRDHAERELLVLAVVEVLGNERQLRSFGHEQLAGLPVVAVVFSAHEFLLEVEGPDTENLVRGVEQPDAVFRADEHDRLVGDKAAVPDRIHPDVQVVPAVKN